MCTSMEVQIYNKLKVSEPSILEQVKLFLLAKAKWRVVRANLVSLTWKKLNEEY